MLKKLPHLVYTEPKPQTDVTIATYPLMAKGPEAGCVICNMAAFMEMLVSRLKVYMEENI